jgi:hypothetical protein
MRRSWLSDSGRALQVARNGGPPLSQTFSARTPRRSLPSLPFFPCRLSQPSLGVSDGEASGRGKKGKKEEKII